MYAAFNGYPQVVKLLLGRGGVSTLYQLLLSFIRKGEKLNYSGKRVLEFRIQLFLNLVLRNERLYLAMLLILSGLHVENAGYSS